MGSSSMGIPPIRGIGIVKIITTVVNVVKSIFDIFKSPSKEAGKVEATDSLENVERITEIFSDLKEQLHLKSDEIEKAVENEVDYYVEELQNILNVNSEKVSKYGIHTKRIERQIAKISARIKGIIDNEVSKKVSLDNSECKEIVRMIPGTKKESAMSDFFARTMKNALESCCNELRSSLDEIYEDVEVEIVGAVEMVKKQTETLQESFSAVDEANYEETVKKQMTEAYYLRDVCDLVMELL